MCYAWSPGGRWRASERQLARSGRSAGGRLWRAVGMTPRRARRGNWLGGPAQSKPV
jgi:hypothetical protein